MTVLQQWLLRWQWQRKIFHEGIMRCWRGAYLFFSSRSLPPHEHLSLLKCLTRVYMYFRSTDCAAAMTTTLIVTESKCLTPVYVYLYSDSWSKGCEFESRQERTFFSGVNFLCWLLFGVRSTPVLLRWHVKDPGHSPKSTGGSLHLHTHTSWPNEVGVGWPCRGPGVVWEHIRKQLTHNLSGNFRPKSS